MRKVCCQNCSLELNNDEVAFNLRLRGMEIGNFYCLPCFASQINCEVDCLRTELQKLKDGGCSFFEKQWITAAAGKDHKKQEIIV